MARDQARDEGSVAGLETETPVDQTEVVDVVGVRLQKRQECGVRAAKITGVAGIEDCDAHTRLGLPFGQEFFGLNDRVRRAGRAPGIARFSTEDRVVRDANIGTFLAHLTKPEDECGNLDVVGHEPTTETEFGELVSLRDALVGPAASAP